jgi:acyl-CoA oxidase
MENWFPRGVRQALNPSVDPRVQHAMSVIMKTTVCRHFQNCVFEMGERLGAQGTFHQNTLARYECDAKGVIIAEGDILTLCIRLFSELLIGRYTIPLPDRTQSRLAHHAHSLLEENRALLRKLKCNHRSATFNNLILPQAQLTIEAIGHALAYSAGVEAGLPKDVLDVYECVAIRRDTAWFSEQGGLSRLDQRVNEDEAVSAMIRNLPQYLDQLGLEDYVRASIVTDDAWKTYLAELPVFRGYAVAQRSDSPVTHVQMQAML